MKIAILTYINSQDHFNSIRNGLLSKKIYCEKYNHDLIFNTNYIEKNKNSWHLLWESINFLLSHLNGTYDYIFFSNSNSLITNLEFDLVDFIKNKFDQNKCIMVSSEITPININENEIFENQKVITNNMILKYSEKTKEIIQRYLDQKFLQNPNLSHNDLFNLFLNHYFKEKKIKDDVQILHNSHLFNSYSDSSVNGWVCGDFMINVNEDKNVSDFFSIFISILKSESSKLHNDFEKVIVQHNNSLICLNKYGSLEEKNNNNLITRVGEWFYLNSNNIAVLFNNDKYWTFIKTT